MFPNLGIQILRPFKSYTTWIVGIGGVAAMRLAGVMPLFKT
jgi:hypothetical protein